MKTALDSSVIWLLLKQQSGWEAWREALSNAALEGQLLMCPITFAECSMGFPNWQSALDAFQMLQISFDPLLPDTAHLAGTVFTSYRKRGGPREHLIPDFIIGAHALCQADRLAAVDRGFYRSYFNELAILSPE